MSSVSVVIEKLIPEAFIPLYATSGSAAMDLVYPYEKDITLWPHETKLIRCGFKVALPKGYMLNVYARSGHALKASVACANGVGVVDSDYRGEICAILHNSHPTDSFTITQGARVAQIVVVPVPTVAWVEGSVNQTERGEGGFGSTGTH